MEKEESIRALIIDDHPVVRYGLRHILDSAQDIDVVGEKEDLTRIEDTLGELAPDVVLLDLELGDIHGVEALRQLRSAAPSMQVIIYTSHDEEDRIIQAAELGIDGYLLKGCPAEEIIDAVRSVNDGGTALEASVASKLMNHMNKRSSRSRETPIQFSKRELQVLDLLAAGRKNRDIGEKLFISESTVKFHVHAILSKLNADNRTEAVAIAAQQGIIDLASTPPN